MTNRRKESTDDINHHNMANNNKKMATQRYLVEKSNKEPIRKHKTPDAQKKGNGNTQKKLNQWKNMII